MKSDNPSAVKHDNRQHSRMSGANQQPENHKEHGGSKMHETSKMYFKLLIMLAFSFAAMYVLMYAMVDKVDNVYFNINQFYMASLMSMAMIVIELIVMWSMYKKTKLKIAILSASCVATIAFFILIQRQTAVSDEQFLKGMIPHHAAAILMSEQSHSQDAQIRKLQKQIIVSQRKEIELMKAKLKELDK